MYIPGTDTVSLIQDRIAEKLGPQKYKVWFRNSTQITLTDGHLKISAPNAFICGWIERHFADQIGEAVQEVCGSNGQGPQTQQDDTPSAETGQIPPGHACVGHAGAGSNGTNGTEYRLSFVVDTRLQHALKKTQLNSQAEFIAKNPERVARQYRKQGAPPPRKLRGRFDDLITGPANELAVSVIRRIAERSAEAYSPVFVHGGCGLGKTHLLHALANELARSAPDCRCAYLTGDEFTNAFVLALRSNQIEAFRQRYRYVDVLIIDDVHFLANKKATQEEFLHTFNAIDARRQHIVLASDSHPKLIGQFSEQLINRFVAGMVVRIDIPDFPMRCEILRRRAAVLSSRPIPDDVIRYIAENLQSNVRELEGALLKLVMFSSVSRQPVSLSLARRALADYLQRSQRALGLDQIDQIVATYFGLTPADLHTSRKTRTIALARSIAMYLARKHTEMSFPEIGRFMGNKNHSTVILANRKIEKLHRENAMVRRQTPAGLREEPMGEIIEKIEEQLGHVRAGRPASAPDGANGLSRAGLENNGQLLQKSRSPGKRMAVGS